MGFAGGDQFAGLHYKILLPHINHQPMEDVWRFSELKLIQV